MEQQISNIHWFPGHMTKTFRLIEKEIKNVDIVIELIDARLPISSKNPELAAATSRKPRFVVLNKADLADETQTRKFVDYYRAHGYGAVAISSKDRKGARKAIDAALSLLNKQNKQRSAIKPAAMVVGVPNIGKSTFINSLAGATKTKAEDRPGVTRGKQLVVLKDIELLDMPGVLWKKLEDQRGALLLAFTGAIKDNVLDTQEISACLLERLAKTNASALIERYSFSEELVSKADGREMLSAVAQKRGMLMSGGVTDDERAANAVLDELRAGKLGRITFDGVPAQ